MKEGREVRFSKAIERSKHITRFCCSLFITTILLVASFAMLLGQEVLAQEVLGSESDELRDAIVSGGATQTSLLELYAPPSDASIRTAAYAAEPFVDGEILVGIFDAQTADYQEHFGSLEKLEKLDLRGLDGHLGTAGVSGWRMAVPVGQELATIDALLQNPAVAFALPNFEVTSTDFRAEPPVDTNADRAIVAAHSENAFRVDDPFYTDRQWYLQRINASRAWALAFKNDLPPIRVAIVDSGGNHVHPEFGPRMLEGVNYVTPGDPAEDDFGHGSHVAGLIGAGQNDQIGISGVAPNAQIDPRKALNSFGSGSITNVAQAIRDATDDGAKVINLSLETGLPNIIMHAAIIYAADKGVLMAAATGNSGASQVQWPAAYPEVIAVAATDYNNQRATYSSKGSQVELAAPGGDTIDPILSTWGKDLLCDYNTQTPVDGDYCIARGTSMAAAIVSGVAALVWSVDPSLSADEVRGVLFATAAPLAGNSNEVGRGLVDAAAAVRWLEERDLIISQNAAIETVDLGAEPYSVTFKIENPSLQAIDWSVEIPSNIEWLTSTALISGSQSLSGTALYGQPAYVTLAISPTNLITGNYSSSLTFIGTTQSNGAGSVQIEQNLPIKLRIGALPQKIYFPQVMHGDYPKDPGTITASPSWEVVDEDEREIHNLTDNSNLFLSLPITYTLFNKEHVQARLYSDGYIVFPVEDTQTNLPNHCLPGEDWSDQIIYGWWTDLDPGAVGSSVFSFSPASDRFVVEFNNVLAHDADAQSYRVTFQIVLYANGNVGLNYRNVPTFSGRPPEVTIGVNAADGRFYNQITCTTLTRQFGTLPRSGQSFLIEVDDLY